MGCYGPYEYKCGDYFAISNSFLKLVEFLYKTKYPISFNENFANHYLSLGITPEIPDETLVNEIKILPRNIIVRINKSYKTISYEKLDFKENTVSIDSEEGMALLDKWYFRWVELIRHLRNKTNFITADISGSFDSRVVSALWLSANINLNNILIYSSKSSKKRFMEDFEIANEIANHFDFKLNQHRPIKIIPLKLIESLNRPSYVELGFHKHRVHPTITYELPHYRISGHCGGLIRNHPNQTFEEYIEKILNHSKKLDDTTYKSTKKLVDLKMDEFCDKYELDKNSRELSALYYKDTRNRYHFGKEWIDSYLYNKITIAPLSDPDLSKLKPNTEKCEDDLLLITIIFLRYCHKLLNFKIEGDREIKKETIQHATEINARYPFTPKKFEYNEGPKPDITINNKPKLHTSDEIKKIFEDIFYSKNFVKEFEKILQS